MKDEFKITIIGAGPAGLTVGYELMKRNQKFKIIEKDNVVGGISRTDSYKGYHFDIGGHRFFTKVKRVMNMWNEVLPNDFLKRPRLSHIYYKRKFFKYPINPIDVITKLGFLNVILSGFSYLKSKLIKISPVVSFEDYIINNFGRRLYLTFFKSYTEKVWGIPCAELSAQWAAQRIKGLSLTSLIKTAFTGNKNKKIKTLIEEFHYPRLGPGMMWQETKNIIENSNFGSVEFNTTPTKIFHANNKITGIEIEKNGNKSRIDTNVIFSSMPLAKVFHLFEPKLNQEILDAADSLNFRDYIAVSLIVDKKDVFPDNWIYIHEPDVLVGRIQNYKNWSPEMVADQSKTCLGLEYFCFETDDLWKMTDKELIKLGSNELEQIGILNKNLVLDGVVIRVKKTYPVYDDAYNKAMPILTEAANQFEYFFPIGRNGMHKYNNQDHSMLTAMLSVENLFENNHNIWEVNTDNEYHEGKK